LRKQPWELGTAPAEALTDEEKTALGALRAMLGAGARRAGAPAGREHPLHRAGGAAAPRGEAMTRKVKRETLVESAVETAAAAAKLVPTLRRRVEEARIEVGRLHENLETVRRDYGEAVDRLLYFEGRLADAERVAQQADSMEPRRPKRKRKRKEVEHG